MGLGVICDYIMKILKGTMVVALSALLLSSFANAQDVNRKWNAFIELQPIFSTADGASHALNLQVGALKHINDNFLIGGSVGVAESFDFDVNPSIPILLRAQAEHNFSGISPFISLDMGYSLNTEDFEYGSVVVNPTVGVRYSNFYIGVGYYAAIPTKSGLKTGNNINLKVGYMFGDGSGDGLKRFIKRTHVDIELGAAYGFSTYSPLELGRDFAEGDNEDDHNHRVGSNVFANVIWGYDIDEHWMVGIGTGVRLYMNKLDKCFNNKQYDYDYETNRFTAKQIDDGIETIPCVPLYVRGKYTFLNENVNFRPYVAVDLGYQFGTSMESCMLFEPQVGVKFGRFNFGIGLSYATGNTVSRAVKNSDFDDEKAWSLSARIGVRL